jgi:hypothetical protein
LGQSQKRKPRAIAYENSQRRSQPTSSNKEQLTKVFASFFKKKCFFYCSAMQSGVPGDVCGAPSAARAIRTVFRPAFH